MCSDERKCAVMNGCFCSDESRRNKTHVFLLVYKGNWVIALPVVDD